MAGAGAGLVPGHDAAPHVAILTDLEWPVLAGSWPVPRRWPGRCDPHRLGMAGAGSRIAPLFAAVGECCDPHRLGMAGAGPADAEPDEYEAAVAILTDLEWPVLEVLVMDGGEVLV